MGRAKAPKPGGLGRALHKDRAQSARKAHQETRQNRLSESDYSTGSPATDSATIVDHEQEWADNMRMRERTIRADTENAGKKGVAILYAAESGAHAGHSLESIKAAQKAQQIRSMSDATKNSGIQDFLLEAELSKKRFETIRPQAVVLSGPLAVQQQQQQQQQRKEEQKQQVSTPSSAISAAGAKKTFVLAGVGNNSGVSGVTGTSGLWNEITIPRRPQWDAGTTADELHRLENESFLQWRRGLATLEESKGVLLTPYEKNINVWKQLWRVVERSDVLIQIVDARNPLLFRCPDLEQYVRESALRHTGAKTNLLVCNKADLLSEEERTAWAAFFVAQRINFVFFSASQEQLAAELAAELEQMSDHSSDYDDEGPHNDELGASDDGEVNEQQPVCAEIAEVSAMASANSDAATSASISASHDLDDNAANDADEEPAAAPLSPVMNTSAVLGRDELLFLIQSKFGHIADERAAKSSDISESEGEVKPVDPARDPSRLVVGFVGYPNVGKSSTINVLMNDKVVSVAATPGKTKHFQTLLLDDESIETPWQNKDESGTSTHGIHLTLCDCPGLVFPTHMSTKADMVCNGLLSIDHMRDFRAPVDLLVKWIPRRVLEDVYSIHLPLPQDLATGSAEPNIQGLDENGHYLVDALPPATAAELLQTYAALRGFRTVHGAPDESRSARIVLKDLLNGRLVYVHAPPTFPQGRFRTNHTLIDIEKLERNERQRQRKNDALQAILSKRKPVSVAAAAMGSDGADALAQLHTPQRRTNELKSPLDRAVHRKQQRLLARGFTEDEVNQMTSVIASGRKNLKGRSGKRRSDALAANFYDKQQASTAHAQNRSMASKPGFTRAF